MEIHSKSKNKWLSNYHNVKEEGEEMRHVVGLHTVHGWRYTSQSGTKCPTYTRESSELTEVLSFYRVSSPNPQKDSCHLWPLDEGRKDRDASYRINFDFLNTFLGHVNI